MKKILVNKMTSKACNYFKNDISLQVTGCRGEEEGGGGILGIRFGPHDVVNTYNVIWMYLGYN